MEPAGVDVEWVITGSRNLDAIEWEFVLELVAVIEEWASERPDGASLAVKRDLLRTFYAQFHAQKNRCGPAGNNLPSCRVDVCVLDKNPL